VVRVLGRRWGVRTLTFLSATKQRGSSPVFPSSGSDGLASSFFWGVALAEGLSSVFLLVSWDGHFLWLL
jgi:hypothetical protein